MDAGAEIDADAAMYKGGCTPLGLIATSIHFLPVHELTAYRELLPDQQPLPVAERAGYEILSLPLSPAHSDDDIADVIAALHRVHDSLTG